MSSFDRITSDDENAGLRQVREEEGIPELEEEEVEEEEEEGEQEFMQVEMKDEKSKVDSKPAGVTPKSDRPPEGKIISDTVHEVKERQPKGVKHVEVPDTCKAVELEETMEKDVVENRAAAKQETPGFTVYLNRRPTSISEIMKDIEEQFVRICDSAHDVSVMLEASRAQYCSSSSKLAGTVREPLTSIFTIC